MNPQTKMAFKTPRREKFNASSSSEGDKSKDPVSVYCRLRNLPDDNDSSCISLVSPTILALSCPTDNRVIRKDIQYEFKHIFTMYASQKEVFDHVAFPLLQDLLKGKNGLLFTYGVTGSGKTYTLTGDPFHPGMMPRCIDTIFNSIGDRQAPKFVIKSDKMNGFEVQSEVDAEEDRRNESRLLSKQKKKPEKTMYANDLTRIQDINETNLYVVFVSYTEIYNNIVYDLLDESSGKQLQSKILREDSNKSMYVNGVVEIEVKSAAEAFELFNIGQKRKRMGHTLLNAESSRSHSIFNIRVVQLQQEARNSNGDRAIPAGNLLQVGQLSLVDLAGSERSSRTQNTGVRLKEASSINNSLMSLRSCMEALRDNQLNNANRLVPYRDTRLTLLFKNYFEGEGKVQMIVCVNPSSNDYEESLQVMKFADMAKDVKVIKAESRYTPYKRMQKINMKTPSTLKATTTAASKIKTAAPLVFGPKIPKFKLDIENLEVYVHTLNKLEDILMTRRHKSLVFNRELHHKEQHLRKRLLEMNQDYTLKCSDLRSAQVQLKKERKRGQNLEMKVLDMEKFCDSLEGKNTALNSNLKRLKTNLDEKDLKLNQNQAERHRQKQKMAHRQEKMTQELDDKLRRQREHYNAACMAKELKLQKVKAVLEQDVDLENIPVIINDDADMEDECESSKHPQSIQGTPHLQSMHSGRNRIVVANRRRSRSAGDVWLEHNAVKPIPLGTVMQPTMKKRKSVTTLKKAGDITNSKQSKYCLIAQEADTDGEVETKVYKGDIVPTCGGGAQVIFNDVERLRQESPVAASRK